jgi:Protein of unknown function (DUF4058)
MKSPFPGMDPYLERHWGDVHSRLVIYIADALQPLLPEGLLARVDERDYLAHEGITERYVQLIDVGFGNRVVTVIEVLSPSNKSPGDGQKLYLQKQRDILRSDVKLVEIDLLRAGARVNAHRPRAFRKVCQICVRREAKSHSFEVYAVSLQLRLPRIRIPLRPTDADIALDLQPLIDQCYANGRYGLTINYLLDPDPPLAADDAKWADDTLRAAGKR